MVIFVSYLVLPSIFTLLYAPQLQPLLFCSTLLPIKPSVKLIKFHSSTSKTSQLTTRGGCEEGGRIKLRRKKTLKPTYALATSERRGIK